MFDLKNYEGCINDCDKASEIIDTAKSALEDLFKAEVWEKLEEAKMADIRLGKLKREIEAKELKCRQLENELEILKQKVDDYDRHRLPREFVKRIVKELTGDFVPGDEVWVVGGKYKDIACSTCRGDGFLNVTYGGGSRGSITCPKCSGSGKKFELVYHPEKRKIEEVQLSLCFEGSRVGVRSNEVFRFHDGTEKHTVDGVFRSEEEAAAVAERRNSKEAET